MTSRLEGEFVFDSAEGSFNRNIYSQYGATSPSLWNLPAASIALSGLASSPSKTP